MAVFDDVVEVISKTLKGVDASGITMETRFEDDLNADSLDLVELIMELEEHYDLAIPDEDAQSISTVGDAVAYVEKRQAEETGA
ncbi:MAG: acyl carrier protein [Chloroflexi bacterium]|nr:acyl carrier protein [Chloroflexota bacterium]MCY3938946.1 acyl carrier protein [Chloroflexota bacterium]